MRRVVLEAAIARRIMRRRDHNAVGKTRFPAFVVREDRVRDRGRRSILVVLREHDFHAVCSQDLQSGCESRHGEGMRIHAEEQRAIDLFMFSI